MYRLSIGVLLATLFALPASAAAADLSVNDTTDAPLGNPSGMVCTSTHNGGCTLRAAVQAADNTPGANTITLPAGHFKLTIAATGATAASDTNDPAHGDLDILTADNLTITGAGSDATTVDANEIDRAFAVQHGGSLTLSKLSIENGDPVQESSGAQKGGGVYSDGGLALSSDVTFRNNSTFGSAFGGAIAVDSDATAFTLNGATFDGNSGSSGGAIFFNAPSLPLAISDATFSGNEAIGQDGGAIYDFDSDAFTVTDSTFTGNSAPARDGGAIYHRSGAAFTVTGTRFDQNIAVRGSAIVDTDSASETISSDSFADNYASSDATVYVDNSNLVTNTFAADEFDRNRVDGDGGAIDSQAGKLTISASSFTQNTGTQGGAVYVASNGMFSLTNTTISANHAQRGGGVYFNAAPPVSFTNDTIAFNTSSPVGGAGGIWEAHSAAGGGSGVANTIVAENAGGDCGGAIATSFLAQVDAGNNIDSDGQCFGGLGVSGDKVAVDPLLSEAAANGGPVKTDALGTSSPAMDAARSSACPATDERGVPRPQGAGCDIGAFEASTPSATITSPANHATFTQGTLVKASYSCSEAGLTGLIASCTAPVDRGAAIDTSTPGSHTFTVTAIDDQGLLATAAVQYTVTLPPPPNTRITRHHVSGDTLTIAFKGTGGSGALTYRCKLGRHGRFKRCTSPKAYAALSKGRHTVQVKAVDAAGQSDPTPATLQLRIRR